VAREPTIPAQAPRIRVTPAHAPPTGDGVIVGSRGNDRDAQLVREVLDGIESGALVSGTAREEVLYFVDDQHPGRGMLEHIDRGTLQLMKSHGRGDVGIHRTKDFRVQAAQERHRRQFRCDYHSATASALGDLRVIALEFLKEHGFTGATDSVDEHARHSDAGRGGQKLLKAPDSTFRPETDRPTPSTSLLPISAIE
jgi:hypothetical protein